MINKRVFVWAVGTALFLLTIAGYFWAFHSPTQPIGTIDEEYEVYCDLLEFLFPDSEVTPLFILSPTTHRSFDSPVKQNIKLALNSNRIMIVDFSRKNAKPWPIEQRFRPSLNARIVPSASLCSGSFKAEKLLDKYPEFLSFIHLTRVGFNQNCTEALVCLKYLGKWRFYHLNKSGRWEVIEGEEEKWKAL